IASLIKLLLIYLYKLLHIIGQLQSCCFKFQKTPIPRRFFVGYEITRDDCPQLGVVTKKCCLSGECYYCSKEVQPKQLLLTGAC
uniref:Chemokine interleukin-8-like domain-containing protein n=1 Tax=Erpetoichthys calabaricus TaxID=27687 RepID=A0A8C4RI27_ERPCA